MKMPEKLEEVMFAPCGMNCAVCYRYVVTRKSTTSCKGCLKGDESKPAHSSKCNIKICIHTKGFVYCYECDDFPCKQINTLDTTYKKRYGISLIENSKIAKERGITAFLELDRQRWTCIDCGGAFSLQDGVCSECQLTSNKGFVKHE